MAEKPVNGARYNHGFSHSNNPFAPLSSIAIEEATQQCQAPNLSGGKEALVESHLAFTNIEQIYQNNKQPLDLHQNFDINGAAGPTNDFLNVHHLPRCSSLLPYPSISFTNPTQKPGVDLPSSLAFLGVEIPTLDNISDPLFHLNLLPTQPPLFLDVMFQSFSGGYGYGLPRNESSLFDGDIGMDEGEGSGGICDVPNLTSSPPQMHVWVNL
ncbi:hypothetical protein Ancab_037307 [Ancistrocladus abbreviatus]